MKKIFSQIHRLSKTVLIIGWAVVLFMLISSTVLYIGAGDVFDYYSAIEKSELLLAGVRPVCVAVGIGGVALEYFLKQKKNEQQ